ncbi:MAG: TolC family protein [Paramuribaculum sp.]|nr:TolC family protein [Paramuribaculum sp.]
MNNHRLLTGVLTALLLSGGVRAVGSNPEIITLEEIFQTAETSSVQLRPSLSAVEEARRYISVARSQRLPDIQASLSLSYIGDGFTAKRDLSDWQKAPIPHFGSGLSLNITQPVYTGGAITSTIDMAGLKTTAARYAADFERDNLRFRLAGFYLDLYKYANLRTVVENNIRTAEKMLAEMKARYEQGTALLNDITRYELLVSNLRLQLVKITNTLDIFNNNLVETAGLPAGTVVLPDSTILSRSLPVDGEGWWQDEATANSRAISLARTGVSISRKAEELVRSEKLPKIGLQAGFSVDGPILVEVPPINRTLGYWWVGVGVSYNIGSLYKSNRSLAKSRMATQVATERLDAESQRVQLSVHQDYIHYLEAYEELKTCRKSVELAESNYNTVATRYSADMALITDLLDAAGSKLDAEQQLVNAGINIIYYYYKLLFTSGKI